MRKQRKQIIKVNNTNSLEGLIQETYNDACLQIIEVQSTINELVSTTNTPEDKSVDDITKIAKEKGNLLKVKDSAIKIKLEIAKLQSVVLKNVPLDELTRPNEEHKNPVTPDDFKRIREMIKENKATENEDE